MINNGVALKVMEVGGVFGAALLLAFPAMLKIVREGRTLPALKKYKLLTTSLYSVLAIVLLAGGLWAWKNKTDGPGPCLVSNNTVVVGDQSSATVGCKNASNTAYSDSTKPAEDPKKKSPERPVK